MKELMHAVVIAAAFAAPVASFAQSDAPVTRSQVKAELRAIEQTGYNPARGEDPDYPADVQAAEARVMQRNLASQGGANSAEGGMSSGSSASGSHAPHE
jgi:hypothetical protein